MHGLPWGSVCSLSLCSCLCRIGLELDRQGVRSEISDQRAEALTRLLLDWRSFRGSDGGTQHPACSVSIPALDLSVFTAIKRRPFFSSASAPPPTCPASSERSRKGHHRVTREPLGRPRVESSPKCVSPAAAEAHAQMVPILQQECRAAD